MPCWRQSWPLYFLDMNIAIIGPNWAGKTTCSKKIAKEFGLVRFSLGQMIKKSIHDHTFLGIMTRPYALRGNFVPDEVANAALEEKVTSNPEARGFVFDGFPCTLYQAIYMIDLLQKEGSKLDGVVFMKATPDVTYARAMEHKNSNGQIEKTPEGIIARINNYKSVAESILRLFAHSTSFLIVDAERPEDEVYSQIQKFIKDVEDKTFKPEPIEKTESQIDQFLATYHLSEKTPVTSHLNLVLMGPPGCGKGTHAAPLSEYLAVPAIATGNLFREHLKNKTPLGAIAGAFINLGRLVPDDVTAAIVKNRLNDNDAMHGFILDGFPRTVPQADALDTILTVSSRSLDGVIYINVPDDVIIKRIAGRRFCPKCQNTYHVVFNQPKVEGICDKDGEKLITREDDKQETVIKRLDAYRQQTLPVIEHYRQRGLLQEIQGDATLDVVSSRIMECCNNLLRKKHREPAK